VATPNPLALSRPDANGQLSVWAFGVYPVRTHAYTPLSMGRFSPKYTKAQKTALFSAAIDQGKTAQQAINLAAAGDLTTDEGDPVEAFEMPIATAREYIREERRRRDGTTLSALTRLTPDEAAKDLYKRCLTITDRQVKNVERVQANGKQPTPETAKAALDLVERVVRLGEKMPKPTPRGQPDTPQAASSLTSDLTRAHKRRLRGIKQDPPLERTTSGNGHSDHPSAA
jgi:hypothetical protein